MTEQTANRALALARRAGEFTRYTRPTPSRWDRITAMMQRAATEIEHRRRNDRRRRRARRLALAGVVLGAGAAAVLARTGMHTNP
jgi:hypothetical protein